MTRSAGRSSAGRRSSPRRRAEQIAGFHAARYQPAQHRHRGRRRGRSRRRSSSSPPSAIAARANGEPPRGRRPRRSRRRSPAGGSSARTPSSTTCAWAAPGLARHDDRRFALRVLDNVFGGTSSSRLFQEVRERRGLAYAVYSFTSAYQDTGQVGLYLGTRPDNLAEAIAVVGAELARMREEPATAEELERAKENLKGRVRAGARVDRRPHEPPRLGDPRRGAAAVARRGGRADRRGHPRRPCRRSSMSCGRPSGCRPPGSAPTRAASTRRSVASAPDARGDELKCADPGRGRRRRRADGADGLPGGRGRRGHGAGRRAPTRRSTPRWPTSCTRARRARRLHGPDTALANAREAVGAGVHVVIGTTGFDPAELDELPTAGRTSSSRPTSRSAPC